MSTDPFVPDDFVPPRALLAERFRPEPLGPQHNESDLAAWSSSIDHIRSTLGFPDGSWPPPEGMSLDENLADLTRHAADFEARDGFTFTVLDPANEEVIGCAELDRPLAQAVADWLAADWPWQRPDRPRAMRDSRGGRRVAGRGGSTAAGRVTMTGCSRG